MFDEYINDYGGRLFGLCQKLCGCREDAEDIYQETWIKAYRSFDRYDRAKAFEGWLTAICVNTYRDTLRRQKWKSLFIRFKTNEEKDSLLSGVSAPGQPDHSDVRDAVNALPEKYRLVTVLYYFNGLDIEKTSEALNIPAGTVKYQLYKAREMLKGRLEPDG